MNKHLYTFPRITPDDECTCGVHVCMLLCEVVSSAIHRGDGAALVHKSGSNRLYTNTVHHTGEQAAPQIVA